jgi:hypothetical protein
MRVHFSTFFFQILNERSERINNNQLIINISLLSLSSVQIIYKNAHPGRKIHETN